MVVVAVGVVVGIVVGIAVAVGVVVVVGIVVGIAVAVGVVVGVGIGIVNKEATVSKQKPVSTRRKEGISAFAITPTPPMSTL